MLGLAAENCMRAAPSLERGNVSGRGMCPHAARRGRPQTFDETTAQRAAKRRFTCCR
jgi:hypothetical protein